MNARYFFSTYFNFGNARDGIHGKYKSFGYKLVFSEDSFKAGLSIRSWKRRKKYIYESEMELLVFRYNTSNILLVFEVFEKMLFAFHLSNYGLPTS